MNVLAVSARSDTAGVLIRTKRAFDRLSPIRFRVARRFDRYGYPADLPWSAARAAYRRADVIHHNESFAAERALRVPSKPSVVHHHGSYFRRHRDALLRETARRGAVGLASTLDLWLMAPDELAWLPPAYDLDWLATYREPVGDGVFRVAHCPTNRTVKGTAAFLAAMDRLGRELPVEAVVVEGATWEASLRAKGRADAYFDQVALGYGCNAVEAWGIGLPVVAGAADATLYEMARRFDRLPFVVADEGSLYRALRTLADPLARRYWSVVGRQHAERFHSESAVVGALTPIYARLAARAAA